MSGRWFRGLVAGGAMLALLGSAAWADFTLDWHLIGTSPFPASNTMGAQDPDRLWKNDVIQDSNGIIYATNANGGNRVEAAPAVTNGSFETLDTGGPVADGDYRHSGNSTINGWTYDATAGYVGIINPAAGNAVQPTDGQLVAWSNGGSLTTTNALGYTRTGTYTLSVDVASVPNLQPSSYSVELLINGNPEGTANLPALSPTGWQTATVNLTIPANSPLYNKSIKVRLAATGAQAWFDNVRLSYVPNTAGGMTLYYPGGGQMNIDFTNSATPDGSTKVYNLPGAIIKMVIAGDNKVYALQNWWELGWHNPIGPERILRINSTGDVDVMYTTDGSDATQIADMTVGSDGNIYFNRADGSSSKNALFWRLRLFGTGAPAVEGPNNTTNQGWLQTFAWGSLEYVGNSNGVDSFWFLATGTQSWSGAAIGWDKIDNAAGTGTLVYSRRMDTLADRTDVLRDYRTVGSAYDPIRKKLWTAGRAYTTTAGAVWGNDHSDTKRDQGMIDLGGGNWGMQSIKSAAGSKAAYTDKIYGNNSTLSSGITLAVKFRVDSYDAGYTGTLVAAAAYPYAAAQGGDTNAVVGVKIVDNNLTLMNLTSGETLTTLGPVTSPTTWHDVRIFVNSKNSTVPASTDSAKCWYNGSLAFDGTITATGVGFEGVLASVGAAVNGYSAGATTAKVTLDWFGMAYGEYTGPATPEDWPDMMDGTTPLSGAFQNCSYRPEDFRTNAMVSRWSADPTRACLFDGVGVPGTSPNPIVGPYEETIFATNNNDQDTTMIPNGRYWASVIEVNPCNGAAWMSITGQRSYDTGGNGNLTVYNQFANRFAPQGQFIITGAYDPFPTAVANGPGALYDSLIVGTYFSRMDNRIYALVLDVNTGYYSLYWAANPNGGECCPIPWADSDRDGDVDMVDFAQFQACWTGDAAISPSLQLQCGCFDQNYDQKIDGQDQNELIKCARGAGIAPDCGQ